MGQSGLVDGLCVSSFWGDQAQLDRFLQMYAVEKAKREANKRGYAVSEHALENGSIKVQITERALA